MTSRLDNDQPFEADPVNRLQLAHAALPPVLSPRQAVGPFKKPGSWQIRLAKVVERAWAPFEMAIREACELMNIDANRFVKEVARCLWDRNNRLVPANDKAILAEAQTARLLSMMETEGFSLDLACARLGIEVSNVLERCKHDPVLAVRIDQAFMRGTAALHEVVWSKAKKGNVPAAMTMLGLRDKRYVPTLKLEISDRDILQSEAFKRLGPKILAVFEIPPPHDAPEDERRGWESAMETARTRFVEMCREE